MQKMVAIEKNNQNSFNVFPNEKTRLVYEKRIGIHYSHCSDFRQVGNQKINSKIKFSSLGGLKILEIYVGACKVFRDLKSVKKDTKEDLVCQALILSGSCTLTFGGESVELNKGEIFILDSTKPIKLEVTNNLHCLAVYMPLALIKSWIPRIWNTLDTRKIKTNTQQGSLLKGFMQLIQKNSDTQQWDHENTKASNSKKVFVPLMAANSAMLVHALLSPNKDRVKTIKEIQLDAAKEHILVHLTDSSISPTTISKKMGFSVRYLHWLFNQEDETVSQYIMRKRIEFAQTLLNSSTNTFFSITDVAFICGFNDSTHFSRRFKQQVGLSPSKYRNV